MFVMENVIEVHFEIHDVLMFAVQTTNEKYGGKKQDREWLIIRGLQGSPV